MRNFHMKAELLLRIAWFMVIAIVILACLCAFTIKEIRTLQSVDEELYRMQAESAIRFSADLRAEKERVDTFIENIEKNASADDNGASAAFPVVEHLGNFTITHYCHENYPHICNDGDSTVTASGAVATVGRTVGVDPSVIPYGTRLLIDGHEYVAEDTGGGIGKNQIDILVEYHQEALDLGKKKADVYRIVE